MAPRLPELNSWKFDPNALRSAVSKSIELSASLDEERDYLCQRAPNIIEWVTRKEYLDQPSLFRFWGAYSLVKEFFELRCPDCNTGPKAVPRIPWTPGRAETGLSQQVLESEVLLRWTPRHEDDSCPKCGTTRAEFVERGDFKNYRVMHCVIGQRCMRLDSLIYTSEGLRSFADLLQGQRIQDMELPHTLGVTTEEGVATSVGVTYAGTKKSVLITTQYGFEEEVGENHPVRVVTNSGERAWRLAKNLSLNDKLLMRVGANMFGTNVVRSPAVRRLVETPMDQVPREILSANRESVVDYILTYFAHRGFMSQHRLFIDQLRLLLLNCGIVTTLEARRDGCWALFILPAYLPAFAAIMHPEATPVPVQEPWIALPIVKLEGGRTEMADLRVPDGECYVANGFLNHNSGKSTMLAQVGTYLEHVVYTIAHGYEGGIAGYLGTAKGDTLDMGWVASTRDQTEDTIWGKYIDYRLNSPWFRRYVPWVKLQQKTQDTPRGMKRWDYNESATKISNEYAKVEIRALSSNSDANAGGTRLFSAVDEICRMGLTEGYRSGSEVYTTMLASCKTVQSRVDRYGLVPYLGMIASISSPKSIDDYGMDLLRRAKHDPRMFTLHKATWDFNPEEPYENFLVDLKKDYVITMRNFGAMPPGAASPLIDRPEDFKKFAIDPTLKPTATFDTFDFIDTVGCDMRGVKLRKADLILRGEPRFIAADAGANFDAFSVACAHGEYDTNGNLVTVFDWIVRILTKSRTQEVYFESIYELLKEIKPRVIIKQIEFDHWNSKQIVQRIRNELGVWAEEVATTDEHFVQFMRDAYSGAVRLLPPEPEDETLDPPYMSAQGAAIYEFLKLERNEKDKILNPLKGVRRGWNSDDTARVCVHVHRLVQDQGYTKKQDDTSRRARRKRGDVGAARYQANAQGGVFKPIQGMPKGYHGPKGGGGVFGI